MERAHPSTTGPRFRRERRLLAAALVLTSALSFAPAAVPCGYHSPEAVVLVALNWIYPKALYVRTAVWQAEDAGILPARPREAPVRDLLAFHRTSADLKTLGDRLNAARLAEDRPPDIALVLVDTVLWTRFTRGAGGYAVEVHAEGPASGDVVLVSHGKVVHALAAQSVTARAAFEHGLIRSYGSQDDVAAVGELLDRMAVPAQASRATVSGSAD